jgi:hypothetical protein
MFTLLCVVGIVSCGDGDSDLQLTGESGRPSKITVHNGWGGDMLFYYRDGKLSEVKEKKGAIRRFSYEDNELASIGLSPEDKTVADGSGWMGFRREDRRIIVEASYEPGFALIRTELELDEHDIPVRITDAGTYSRTGENGELTLIREGQSYAELTYDSATGQLVKQVVYDRATSEKTASYDYEYDGNTGAASKINLPLWYLAYSAYGDRDYRSAYNRLLFNYSGNLVRETVVSAEEDGVYNYDYRYDRENVPVSMKSDIVDITITY